METEIHVGSCNLCVEGGELAGNWQCHCGHWNNSDDCHWCGRTIDHDDNREPQTDDEVAIMYGDDDADA